MRTRAGPGFCAVGGVGRNGERVAGGWAEGGGCLVVWTCPLPAADTAQRVVPSRNLSCGRRRPRPRLACADVSCGRRPGGSGCGGRAARGDGTVGPADGCGPAAAARPPPRLLRGTGRAVARLTGCGRHERHRMATRGHRGSAEGWSTLPRGVGTATVGQRLLPAVFFFLRRGLSLLGEDEGGGVRVCAAIGPQLLPTGGVAMAGGGRGSAPFDVGARRVGERGSPMVKMVWRRGPPTETNRGCSWVVTDARKGETAGRR